jgi:hypothetical protein
MVKEQTMNKQIEEIKELTNELVFTSNYGTYNAVAEYLHNKGYRKASDVAVEAINAFMVALLEKAYNECSIAGYKSCVVDIGEIDCIAYDLKKKYESEGADDE